MSSKYNVFKGHWKERLSRKGDLKYIILDLIKEKPRYGYEIIKLIEERSHGIYTPSAGAVYPALQVLEEKCYIIVSNRDEKKVYTITADGREFLSEQKDLTEEIKGSINRNWNPDNFSEIAKTMEELSRFRKLFGHKLRQLDVEGMQRIRKIISRAYEDVEEIINENKETLKRVT